MPPLGQRPHPSHLPVTLLQRTTLLLTALVGCLSTTPVNKAFSAEISSLPNIVFILADDQGWNALSTRMDPSVPGSGSTFYQTPRLAKLAAEGMRFSQAYSPAPTCSPTRHSIQFGRSPASLKIFGADGIRDSTGVTELRASRASIQKESGAPRHRRLGSNGRHFPIPVSP